MDYDVYLHTLYTSRFYNTNLSLELLTKILESNALLSRRKQGITTSTNFCGLDYISLTDYEKRNLSNNQQEYNNVILYFISKLVKDNSKYNSYEKFVKPNTSIIFPKSSIDKVYETITIDKQIGMYDTRLMIELGLDEFNRYSDLPDEVQVKDSISLDKMSGLMIPAYEIMNFIKNNNSNYDIISKEVELYRKLLQKYNKDVPIYDSISLEPLDTKDGINAAIYALRLYNK